MVFTARFSEDLGPEYYMGWVIQPHKDGFLVYDRADHSKPKGEILPSMIEAYDYINKRTKGV